MRGEGNHKIPGSFAPENMEKTGAERVKYSLACQHEDAIPIKFVSYAQKCPTVLCTFAVALRKESVDRNNIRLASSRASTTTSLSARRAWIEMVYHQHLSSDFWVALRKESVDRNYSLARAFFYVLLSLSARRAWIEIFTGSYHPHFHVSLSARRAWIEISALLAIHTKSRVALRKESVDRNKIRIAAIDGIIGSLSARRAWIEIHKMHAAG